MSQAQCLRLSLIKMTDRSFVDGITAIGVDGGVLPPKSSDIGCATTRLVCSRFIEYRLRNVNVTEYGNQQFQLPTARQRDQRTCVRYYNGAHHFPASKELSSCSSSVGL